MRKDCRESDKIIKTSATLFGSHNSVKVYKLKSQFTVE